MRHVLIDLCLAVRRGRAVAAGLPGVLRVVTARAALALAALPALSGAPAGAADMPRTVLVEPSVAIPQRASALCLIDAPAGRVEVFQEPRGRLSGFLPAGMIVEVLDFPSSDRTDLWVRIKPPRRNDYYGWVATGSFVCL